MNERIRELIEQARVQDRGYFIYQYGGPNGHQSVEKAIDLEKFAQLIMKEYEKLLPEMCPWADADKEGPMKGWHVQFVARKHFGVEE